MRDSRCAPSPCLRHTPARQTFSCGECGCAVIDCLRCWALVCVGCDQEEDMACPSDQRMTKGPSSSSLLYTLSESPTPDSPASQQPCAGAATCSFSLTSA